MAAGAQITQSQYGEVVTINNNVGIFKNSNNWNESNLDLFSRNHWRASLVPAAAVIPAPIAYVKVAAVKKLVVQTAKSFYGNGVSFFCVIRFLYCFE